MPLKYWAFAGISITNWCSAACPQCYMCCDPQKNHWMEVDQALDLWDQLERFNPQGCRIHITGGEPFGDFDRLLTLCEQARARGLGNLQKVETNGYWATDLDIIKRRLTALDRTGMEKLAISADPFHQLFVPIEQVRFLVRIAEEILGADRVQVRWRDWLDTGFDPENLAQVKPIAADWIVEKRDRVNGRAAECLADTMPRKQVDEFAGRPCKQGLLLGKHVHISSDGEIIPGVCSGVSLGNVNRNSVADIWTDLFFNWQNRPALSMLSNKGAHGLYEYAKTLGFIADEKGYCTTCHLCWEVRKFLADKSLFADEIAPAWIYNKVGS